MLRTSINSISWTKKIMNLDSFHSNSKLKRKENKKFFRDLKRINSKKLDQTIHSLHNNEFECTDCLKCANCCKTTGPLFTDKDISRISKFLKIKSVNLIKYRRTLYPFLPPNCPLSIFSPHCLSIRSYIIFSTNFDTNNVSGIKSFSGRLYLGAH